MADWNATANAIFLEALDLHSPEQRRAYLDQACGDDTALRTQVEALLAASERVGSFLEKPAGEHVTAAAGWLMGAPKPRNMARGAVEATGTPPNKEDLGKTCADPSGTGEPGQPLAFLSASQQQGSLGRLGHYEVLEVVGRGGMGVVLRAFDETLQRVVAIKTLAAELATSASARKRFAREAKAAAAVRNEHVIDIHQVEEAGPVPYLVMEYIRGCSLQDRLDQVGPLELKEALRIGMQIASGLAAAHAQGLVHRDIKPANILLENGVERVKITDFGLARAVDDASLTQSGVIAGTPQYMSPEQAEGKAVDHRSDLFSLGSVLYAVCTGHPPFRAETTMGVLRRVCDDVARPIRHINPEVPAYLATIVEQLHAKDPQDRFQSAAEVAGLLGRHLADVQQPTLGITPRLARGTRRYRTVAGLALLATVLSTVGIGGWWLGWFSVRESSRVEREPIQPSPAAEKPPEAANQFANSIGMRMRLISAGTFTMGSPGAELGHTDEEYMHRVRITRAFYMGVYEVTQKEYSQVMGGNTSWFSPTGGGKDRVAALDSDRLPVDSVTWDDAVAFCRTLSDLPAERAAGHVYRLPTEAEWEYACRAGTETVFHFGNALSSAQANFDGRSPYGQADRSAFLQRTAPVGSHAPNAWGLHDMHGNVWEWCQDGYAPDYYRESPTEDPLPREPADLRIMRGGSWYSTGAACRAAFRNKQAPDTRSYYVGFRVVCNAR
jgi:formylglycine-generating enzyme required for sulfatase activity